MQGEKEWGHVDQALKWVNGLRDFGIKPGLSRMEWMLERVGHPERRLKFIHVGGTNGKGSTVSFMRHVLQEAGFDVGSFTSPSLERFQDRIQVNGQDIPDEALLTITTKIKDLADELSQTEHGAPTEFEVLTMMAILYFATVSYPDVVLWEVGLGGRLDSTNVVMPILSVITNVGYDHIHILGDRIDDIAFEKAGIIKPGIALITGVQDHEVLHVLQKQVQKLKSTMYKLEQEFHALPGAYSDKEQLFTYQSMFAQYNDLAISLQGLHQVENAAMAIMALEVLKQYYALIWDEDHLRAGLRKASWPGRMEKVCEVPLTLLDGAHNPQGMAALAKTIDQYYANRSITVLFSAMQDKEVVDMLQYLDGRIDRLILTQAHSPRIATAHSIREQLLQVEREWTIEVSTEEDWYAAYRNVVQGAHENEVFLITGSLYFIAEVRRKLKNNT